VPIKTLSIAAAKEEINVRDLHKKQLDLLCLFVNFERNEGFREFSKVTAYY